MASSEKLFLRALKGETTERPPIWLMRQAGRYLPEYLETRAKSKNFLHFCYSPDLAEEVTLQPLRRYGFDAAILFADILTIPDALGQKVEFIKGEGPKLEPIRNSEELSKLSLTGIHDHLAPVYETVSRLSKSIPETTALIGFAGAPWTNATYMVEGKGSKTYETIRLIAYQDPDFFQELINLLVEATSEYLLKQIEAGAEAVQIFDSWAGVLPEEQFDRWVIEPNKEITSRIKDAHPDIPVIGFPRGAGPLYKKFVVETGVDGVSIDQTVPLDWAIEELQPHCCVQGNLDNLAVVAGGEQMEAQVQNILEKMSHGPFIFNLGHGIVPQTPPENVARVVEMVQNFDKTAI
ncbi:uroporphyrinogen decarboxylase [Terasakiella sp. SH-1]|uniref:uroporphyrinogen decarboxylase n=1 Tax=Terasakiella sp. SH-1 TaxID=2560057 RepID=UPI001073E6CE|nr:uroporphyrinogen decarboxylase [Terasakiella sp. SH-1]